MTTKANIHDRLIGETLYTNSGEIAVVTRTFYLRQTGETQLYGQYCTGPLSSSMNSAGEPNEFLLTVSDEELEHFGITRMHAKLAPHGVKAAREAAAQNPTTKTA